MWIAGLVVIAAIAATYRLTHPPGLVWWTSPPIAKAGQHVRLLVPQGWEYDPKASDTTGYVFDPGEIVIVLSPVDRTPSWLRWLLPKHEGPAMIAMIAGPSSTVRSFAPKLDDGKEHVRTLPNPKRQVAYTFRHSDRWGLSVWLVYDDADRPVFNATHAAICNSLRIE
jgi:hypothetical protein